jgi:hypothetical protein
MIEQKYAIRHGFTDVDPYEIVRVISDQTLEVRRMDSELDPEWTPEFLVGGFAGHCTNQHEQRWIFKSNPEHPTERIRLRKRGGWKDPYGTRFTLSDVPKKFYDYNF